MLGLGKKMERNGNSKYGNGSLRLRTDCDDSFLVFPF